MINLEARPNIGPQFTTLENPSPRLLEGLADAALEAWGAEVSSERLGVPVVELMGMARAYQERMAKPRTLLPPEPTRHTAAASAKAEINAILSRVLTQLQIPEISLRPPPTLTPDTLLKLVNLPLEETLFQR